MAGQGWTKNKRGFMVNADGKTARQVKAEKRSTAKAVTAEVVTDTPFDPPKNTKPKGKSRIGQLIDTLETQVKNDKEDFIKVARVYDRASRIVGKTTGVQGSIEPAARALPGDTPKKKGRSRFGAVVDAVDTVKADTRNMARAFAATAKMANLANEGIKEAEKEVKKLKQPKKRKSLKGK